MNWVFSIHCISLLSKFCIHLLFEMNLVIFLHEKLSSSPEWEKQKWAKKWTIISLCVLFFKDEDNKNDCYQIADLKISFQRLSFYWNCILQASFSWRCILGCWLVHKISLSFIWHIIAEKACTQLKPPKKLQWTDYRF